MDTDPSAPGLLAALHNKEGCRAELAKTKKCTPEKFLYAIYNDIFNTILETRSASNTTSSWAWTFEYLPMDKAQLARDCRNRTSDAIIMDNRGTVTG